MGTGWKRAFCTRNPEPTTVTEKEERSPSHSHSYIHKSSTKLNFFSSASNNTSTTPRSPSQSSPTLRCQTIAEVALTASSDDNSPRLACTSTTPKSSKSLTTTSNNPTSPRSPMKLSLFKNSFKLKSSSCGVCLKSVKAGEGKAIYTAECSHAFHFPCIVSHVRHQQPKGLLLCPVCSSPWNDLPLLPLPTINHNHNINIHNPSPPQNDVVISHSTTTQTRSYDDDEPLLSPTYKNTTILPIPEEEADEDNVEFQGFFLPPKPTAKPKEHSRNVSVKLAPECAIISASHTHHTCALLLKLKAPSTNNNNIASPILDPSLRAPIDLVTVLDVSETMQGPKLHMLKRAMRLVISSLGPADRLSIVAFSASAKRLFPLRRMSAQGQRSARRIVDRLVCSQGNSVNEALTKANKVLHDRRERNPVASIMLLSDGQDQRAQNQRSGLNQGHVDYTYSTTRFGHIEIPVHESGFGEKTEPGEGAFARCVGGLLSVVVQDLRIQLSSSTAEIAAVYSCGGRPTGLGCGPVRMGDMYAGEEREILLEMRVPTDPACSLGYGAHHVMTVRCVYKDPVTSEIVYGGVQSVTVPLTARSNGVRVERLRNMFVMTRAVAESRRLVECGDFRSAHHLLASSRALLMQSSVASAGEFVSGLEAELAGLHWRIQRTRETALVVNEDGEPSPLTPTSAWRAAEKLAKMALVKKSLNRVSDLHGFENARF